MRNESALASRRVCRQWRHRKKPRERESADQFELARVSRLTTMGAMTASIAHEINQPLAAIAANANAGLRWLSRATPDLEEVHAALKRINNDAHRASEVIQGIRSIFKKAPQQGALIDLVRQVVGRRIAKGPGIHAAAELVRIRLGSGGAIRPDGRLCALFRCPHYPGHPSRMEQLPCDG